MNGTYWVKHSILAVTVAIALAAPVGAATPDAWITTKTKLSLLTTEGVSGTAIHVDTILGKVTLHGAAFVFAGGTFAPPLTKEVLHAPSEVGGHTKL